MTAAPSAGRRRENAGPFPAASFTGAAQELRFIRALADSAPVALYHTDARGRLTYANAPYRSLFQLGSDDDLESWAHAVHPLDRERMQRAWAGFCLAPCASQFQWRTESATGEVRHFAEAVVPVLARGLAGFVGTITDVTELKRARSEVDALNGRLVDASRQAGRAELANSVLHNVGNVLNSVNVSATLVSDCVRTSKATGLHRVVALVEEAAGDLGRFFREDERGRQLPGYLSRLAAQITLDQQHTLAELSTLQKNIEHIKDIVSMQQSYAKLSGITGKIDVAELVEDSLRLHDGALARHGVRLERDYQSVPAIVVDKHKVLQILVNLIRNAQYACDASARAHKLMTLRIAPGGRAAGDGAAGARSVCITVADNGVGIRPEHRARLFQHGFTTKQEGHGFGLHSGALAAREMGGALSAASPGPDCGASFTLELPLQPPDVDHA